MKNQKICILFISLCLIALFFSIKVADLHYESYVDPSWGGIDTPSKYTGGCFYIFTENSCNSSVVDKKMGGQDFLKKKITYFLWEDLIFKTPKKKEIHYCYIGRERKVVTLPSRTIKCE